MSNKVNLDVSEKEKRRETQKHVRTSLGMSSGESDDDDVVILPGIGKFRRVSTKEKKAKEDARLAAEKKAKEDARLAAEKKKEKDMV